MGRTSRAEEILQEGLKHNPYSQELNYVLGEILLSQGKAAESIVLLECAVRIDYQDQYQHSVSQAAVLATLAQACEAVGDTERAKHFYEVVLKLRDVATPTIKEYAKNRLISIAALQGEKGEALLEKSDTHEDLLKTLLQLSNADPSAGLGEEGIEIDEESTEEGE